MVVHFIRSSLLFICLLLLPSIAYGQVDISNHNNQILFKRAANQQCIILIHGITATTGFVVKIEEVLIKENYHVANILWYTGGKLETITDNVFAEGLNKCRAIDDVSRIHLIGHSTGGIIIRHYLTKANIDELGYILMLGTPNHGSYLSNLAKITMGDDYDRVYGETGAYLNTGKDSFISKLPDARGYHLGVIAGTGHISLKDKLYGLFLRGVDDGRVSVNSNMIRGMNDFIIAPYQHNELTEQADIHQQIIFFLDNGRFSR